MAERDEFGSLTIKTIAARAGYRCSNPTCFKLTSRPDPVTDAAINSGVAAHICAASPGGPRYDETMSPDERKSSENGIWLCQMCSRVIDVAPEAYPIETLRAWKKYGETQAARDSSASRDRIKELLELIDKTHLKLTEFVQTWQSNEPPHNFNDFADSTGRSIQYSNQRRAAYHRELTPLIQEIISITETILGRDSTVTEAQEYVLMGPTNYISMFMLDERLQRLRSRLAYY